MASRGLLIPGDHASHVACNQTYAYDRSRLGCALLEEARLEYVSSLCDNKPRAIVNYMALWHRGGGVQRRGISTSTRDTLHLDEGDIAQRADIIESAAISTVSQPLDFVV